MLVSGWRMLSEQVMAGMQGVRKLLEYLTPLGQKRNVSENNEQSGEASASEVSLSPSGHLQSRNFAAPTSGSASCVSTFLCLFWD